MSSPCPDAGRGMRNAGRARGTRDWGLGTRATVQRSREFAALALPFLLLSATAYSTSGSASRVRRPASLPQSRVPSPESRAFRVCADPNNLPFSDSSQAGFENRIASLIASELKEPLEYTWWAQRRGFFRSTVNAGKCDVVMGVPTSLEMVRTTAPYYRSTYVFVTRRSRMTPVRTFDDPRLHRLKIGVHLAGDDGANTPPAFALATRGIVRNVEGYTLYGDYRQPSPPSKLVEAVSNGDLDVAVVWGPLAGYYAQHMKHPLDVVPVSPQFDRPFLPFVFDIAIGVRRGDDGLRAQIQHVLDTKKPEIDRILKEYGVPRLDLEGQE